MTGTPEGGSGRTASWRADFGRRRRRQWLGPALVVAVVTVLVLALPIALLSSERTVTLHVTHHERVCSGSHEGNSKCQYLVYSREGTFADKDSLLFRKFDSSDVYGRIIDGHTYRADVIGWRLPFFSHYPNIIRLTETSS